MDLLVGLILIALYFLPSIIAATKHSARSTAIFTVNLLLGWSVVGWIVALVWALSVKKNTDQTGARDAVEAAKANAETSQFTSQAVLE